MTTSPPPTKDDELRVPSPPPRRLSRSSIDLRDLELQHEKISHTDSAPSIVGIDSKYLKSSDSEPLHFQQQLQQQLKFQEQIQQQYYLQQQHHEHKTQSSSKKQPHRQNSYQKINNFLQPFLLAVKTNNEDEDDDEGNGKQTDDSGDEAEMVLGDVGQHEERWREEKGEDAMDDVNDNNPELVDKFYVNYHNEKISLNPPDYTCVVRNPSYGVGALSESDFLTIKNNQKNNNDVLVYYDDFSLCRANNVNSSSKELAASVKAETEVMNPGVKNNRNLWNNLSKGARTSSWKKFSASNRSLMSSLFVNCGKSSKSGSNYKFLIRNRNVGSAFSDSNFFSSSSSVPKRCIAGVGHEEEDTTRVDLMEPTVKNFVPKPSSGTKQRTSNDEKFDIIKNLIFKTRERRGGSHKRNLSEDDHQTSECEYERMVMANEATVCGENGSRNGGGVNQKRMRVFSDGDFDEKLIDSENLLKKNNRPRVLSEGNETGLKEIDFKRNFTATANVQTATTNTTTSTSTSTNDTPDILIGLLNVTESSSQTTQNPEEVTSQHLPVVSPEPTPDISQKMSLDKVLLMDLSEEEQQRFIQDTDDILQPARGGYEYINMSPPSQQANVNVSIVDQELHRSSGDLFRPPLPPPPSVQTISASPQVSPPNNRQLTTAQNNSKLLSELSTLSSLDIVTSQTTLMKPPQCHNQHNSNAGNSLLINKPEIVMDSTLSNSNGSSANNNNNNNKFASNMPSATTIEDQLCDEINSININNSCSNVNGKTSASSMKSPSALMRRGENGARLRQPSVVTYDVNVINFCQDDYSNSDNYQYNVNGSFSSGPPGAGGSGQHNGRQSTSSASMIQLLLFEMMSPRFPFFLCLVLNSFE